MNDVVKQVQIQFLRVLDDTCKTFDHWLSLTDDSLLSRLDNVISASKRCGGRIPRIEENYFLSTLSNLI